MRHGGVPASRAILKVRIGAFDAACCVLAPAVAFLIRDQGIATQTPLPVVLAYVGTSVFVSFVCVAAFDLCGIVSRFFSTRDALRIGQAALLAVLGSVMALFIAFRLDTIPRAVPVLHVIILASLLIGGRMLSRARRRKKDQTGRPTTSDRHTHTIIIGANALTRAFINMTREVTNSQELVVGILASSARLHGRRIAGCPVLGLPGHLAALLEEYETHGLRIDRVVVTDDLAGPGTPAWTQVGEYARRFAFDLEYLPDVLVPVFRPEASETGERHDDVPVMSPRRDFYWSIRRGVDIVGGGVLLVATFPLLLVVSAAVLVELGFPAIFWQQRLGRGKKPIKVYKFRTMRSSFDRHGRAWTGAQMGPIGRFLRATRLDELPQLYNITIGEMSFIGPRPLLPVDQPDDLERRLAIRPGLTGWAQVQGGRYLTRDEKARLDVWYIENASFALDFAILMRTISVVFQGDKEPVSASPVARSAADIIAVDATAPSGLTAPPERDPPKPGVRRTAARAPARAPARPTLL